MQKVRHEFFSHLIIFFADDVTAMDVRLLPYSDKFSWVQIFVDMPPDPPEEIFVVFISWGASVVQTTPISLHIILRHNT